MNTATTSRAESSRKSSCHHERHISGNALKVYNLFWRLAKKSKTGSISITNHRIAKLIGAHAGKRGDHITRVKTALVRNGWLEFQGVSKGSKTGTWGGGRYVPISHNEWSESKAIELGHSPCDPEPVQVQVSKVKPGGRAYKRKRPDATDAVEVRTDEEAEVRTAKGDDQSSRAGWEVRTDLVVGSTRTVRGGKYAQSVDLQTVERCVQLTPQRAAAEPSPTDDPACAVKPQHQENRQESSPKQEEGIEGVKVVEIKTEMAEPAPHLEDPGAAQGAAVARLRWQDDMMMRRAGITDPEEWARLKQQAREKSVQRAAGVAA
jgi:hypothetical protein